MAANTWGIPLRSPLQYPFFRSRWVCRHFHRIISWKKGVSFTKGEIVKDCTNAGLNCLERFLWEGLQISFYEMLVILGSLCDRERTLTPSLSCRCFFVMGGIPHLWNINQKDRKSGMIIHQWYYFKENYYFSVLFRFNTPQSMSLFHSLITFTAIGIQLRL